MARPEVAGQRGVDEHPLAGFERFAGTLTLDSGQRMQLADFQRFLLEPYLAGATECVLSTPKGQGKSTLLGALALYELLSAPEADIIIAAASRDQAAVLLGQAAGFVRRSPALSRRVRMTRREIHLPARSGRLRVISADANTGDGLLPWPVVLCDELHRWRSADLFETLQTSLTKRGGKMLTISTAGVREESPLWPIRERALELNVKREGVRLSADSEDGSFALRELSAPDDADWHDLAIAGEVNPLVSPEALAQRFASPTQNERSWRRFTLNQWLDPASEEGVITPDEWDALLDESGERPTGVLCFGVDVSLERDIASICVAGYLPGEKVLIQVIDSGLGVSWVPERLVKIVEANSALPVIIDNVGPAGALIPRLQEWDIDVRETNTREFAQSLAVLLDLIKEDRLRHRGDPPLRHAVQGAATRPLSDSRAWSRKASLTDVSPLVASTLAAWGLCVLGPVTKGPFSNAITPS
jgi:phage terminase large subunit-like protein